MKKKERERATYKPEKFSARIGKSSGINGVEGCPKKKRETKKRRPRERPVRDQMKESL